MTVVPRRIAAGGSVNPTLTSKVLVTGSETRRRAKQQCTGQAAADRSFGQREVDGRKRHPDDRQQQSVDDEYNDGGEMVVAIMFGAAMLMGR
jgi:hypothetical protein